MDRHSLQQPRRGLLLARQNLPGTLVQSTPAMQHNSLRRQEGLPSLGSCSYRVGAHLPPQVWQLAAPSRLALLQQLLLQRMDALASARHLRAQVLCALEREPPGRHYQMPSRLTGEAAAPTGGALLSCIWCCGTWSCCG